MQNVKLKARIIECYGTVKKFADAVGTSSSSVSHVLAGDGNITAKKIAAYADALNISQAEIGDYFFAEVREKK